MKRRLPIVPVMVVALSLLAAPSSLANNPTPAGGATWSDNQQVPYRWKDGSKPPQWLRPAINAAAQDSNDTRQSRAAIFSHSADAKSWIGYTPDIPTNYAVGYAVRNVPNSFNIRLRPHGHVLDWGKLRWCQFFDDPPNGCYDARMITLHEFGHVQTLGHVDESLGGDWLDSVMHAGPRTKAKIGWNQHHFGRCDVATLQKRYQALNTRTLYSTCLSLSTSLTLTASKTSVAPQGSVTFSATLRVGDDAPNKLRGDLLSGRAVTLQRRVPGSSSWTDVTQMSAAAGDGKYTHTARPTTTYEWRALFRKPAAEGLTRSTSTPLTVSVSNCIGDACCSAPTCADEAPSAPEGTAPEREGT
jgi:hypothetical protein